MHEVHSGFQSESSVQQCNPDFSHHHTLHFGVRYGFRKTYVFAADPYFSAVILFNVLVISQI